MSFNEQQQAIATVAQGMMKLHPTAHPVPVPFVDAIQDDVTEASALLLSLLLSLLLLLQQPTTTAVTADTAAAM